MKLIELISVTETLLENRLEPIQVLLESKLLPLIPQAFNLWEVNVTEHFNSKGNYSLLVRVLLEHKGTLMIEEIEEYTTSLSKAVDSLTKTLLESKNTLFNHRNSVVKIL